MSKLTDTNLRFKLNLTSPTTFVALGKTPYSVFTLLDTGKKGVVNHETGELMISPNWDRITVNRYRNAGLKAKALPENDAFVCELGDQKALIKATDIILVPLGNYDFPVSRYLNKAFAVTKYEDDKTFMAAYDLNGNQLVDFKESQLMFFSPFIKVANSKLLYNYSGKLISDKFDVSLTRGANLAITKVHNKKGLINSDGKTILEPIYATITYDNGFFFYYSKGKCGVVTNSGEILYPLKYSKYSPLNYLGYFALFGPKYIEVFDINGKKIFKDSDKITNIGVKDKKIYYQNNTGTHELKNML